MAILDVHQPPEITALLFGDFELRLDSGELLRCANLEDDSV